MQVIRCRLGVVRRLVHVQQVAVDVVLEDEFGRVEPVVKDLAAHDVSPDTPAVGIALVAEPVVAEDLGVKVVRLKGRVVDVHLGPLEEEEAVVIHQLVAPIQAEEDRDVDAGVVMDQLFPRC